ncbi:MAG: hypothetical protein U0237_08595 [Thermoleophilia bacterium]
MRARTALALTALAAALPASAATAGVQVRTLHEQAGLTRQVVIGDRTVGWTRCMGAEGPTELWTAPVGRGRPARVPRVSVPGPCEPVRLVGTFGDQVLAMIPGADGLERLVSVNRRTGVRTVVDAESAVPGGIRLVAADLDGPRLVWLREQGTGVGATSEVVLADVRRPAGARVIYTRSLAFGAVRTLDVWAGPNGTAVVRQVLSGALYGYGERDERALLVGIPRPLQIVRVTGGARVAAGDLSNRWFVYSVARDGDPRVRVTAYELSTGKRRLIRLARLVPAGVPATPPAVPAPRVSGDLAAWRERLRGRGGFRDRVVTIDLAKRRARTAYVLADTRGQRLFVSQPAVRGARVALAEVRLSTAYGATGGFLGDAPVGARSRIVLARVR